MASMPPKLVKAHPQYSLLHNFEMTSPLKEEIVSEDESSISEENHSGTFPDLSKNQKARKTARKIHFQLARSLVSILLELLIKILITTKNHSSFPRIMRFIRTSYFNAINIY